MIFLEGTTALMVLLAGTESATFSNPELESAAVHHYPICVSPSLLLPSSNINFPFEAQGHVVLGHHVW